MITNKEEMLTVLAKIAEQKRVELSYDDGYGFIANLKALMLCDDLTDEVGDLAGKIPGYESKLEYYSMDVADNDLMQYVYKILREQDNDVGYIRFSGRYSSWDSSYFNLCEVVYPKQITKTIYESKLDKNIEE